MDNNTAYTQDEVAGIAIGVTISGFVVGLIVCAVLLVKLPTLYSKLARCVRPKAGPDDILVVDDNSKPGTSSRTNYHYTEIDEKNTHTVSFSVRDGYTDCKINGNQHKYSDLEVNRANASYEPVSVQNSRHCETNNRTSGQIYHILEPGSNKRLPVKPLEVEMLNDEHVYFKLEPGSNRVVQVPRTIVNVAYGSRDFTSDDLMYFVLVDSADCRDSTCSTEPYAVNDINDEPTYYTLEKHDYNNSY